MIHNLIVKTLPIVPKPLVYLVAKKYIAGQTLDDAVKTTQKLENIGGMSTIDVLGEFVDTREKALEEKKECSGVLDAIHDNDLLSYLSLKPTSLGLGIDFNFAYENIKSIVEYAESLGIFVRLDMENSPYTTLTINLLRKLHTEGFKNVGIVFQAYLRRTEEDIKSLMDIKPSIRLCKGIYNEDREIAFKDTFEIQYNYRKLLRLIVENGLHVGIATHDEVLIEDAAEYIDKQNLSKDDYEFQMLLGVREEKRNELLAAGHKLRVYVPYGGDWFGYSSRRLKENPEIAKHIIKAFFSNLSFNENSL